MSIVIGRRESQWKKDDGTETTTYWIALEGAEGKGRDVPCYDERAATLAIDAPLPDGWEVKQSKAGKDYLAPPKVAKMGGWSGSFGGGGNAAFRNTKEGAAAERESIHRSVALTQAVLYAPKPTAEDLVAGFDGTDFHLDVLDIASKFYIWLSSPAASLPVDGGTGIGAARQSSDAPSGPTSSAGVQANTAAQAGGSSITKQGTSGSTSHPAAPQKGGSNGGSGSKVEGVLGKASSAKAPATTTNDELWGGMGVE